MTPAPPPPINAADVKAALALKTFAQGAERNQVSEGQNVIVASVPLPVKRTRSAEGTNFRTSSPHSSSRSWQLPGCVPLAICC